MSTAFSTDLKLFHSDQTLFHQSFKQTRSVFHSFFNIPTVFSTVFNNPKNFNIFHRPKAFSTVPHWSQHVFDCFSNRPKAHSIVKHPKLFQQVFQQTQSSCKTFFNTPKALSTVFHHAKSFSKNIFWNSFWPDPRQSFSNNNTRQTIFPTVFQYAQSFCNRFSTYPELIFSSFSTSLTVFQHVFNRPIVFSTVFQQAQSAFQHFWTYPKFLKGCWDRWGQVGEGAER